MGKLGTFPNDVKPSPAPEVPSAQPTDPGARFESVEIAAMKLANTKLKTLPAVIIPPAVIEEAPALVAAPSLDAAPVAEEQPVVDTASAPDDVRNRKRR